METQWNGTVFKFWKKMSTYNSISNENTIIQDEGKIKTFLEEGKLRWFSARKSVLREILREVL